MSKKFKGEAVKNLRILAGKTLDDVAHECGFDKSSLSKWENGSKPGPRNLKRLSKFFQVPIASFFAILLMITGAAPASAGGPSIPAQTIYGEARGESEMGMIAVGEVIRNRVRARSWYGHDADSVCLRSWQFSFWNDRETALRTIARSKEEVMQRAERAWLMSATSNWAQGATHYCRYDVWPDWRTSPKTKYVTRIGKHVFYREK